MHELARVLGPGERDQRLGDVAPAHLVVLAAELGEQPAQLGEPLVGRPGEAVGRPDVDAEQLAAGAHRHARGAPDARPRRRARR